MTAVLLTLPVFLTGQGLGTTAIPEEAIDAQDDHDIVITVPEVALLDLETDNRRTVTIAPQAPVEAGNSLDFSQAEDASLWINYSSVISRENEPSRKVAVAITSGQVPAGTRLEVQASPAVEGSGQLGQPVDVVTLSDQYQDLITGIGSAFTGNGPRYGHQLTYRLRLRNDDRSTIAELDYDTGSTVTITYTLTDN